VNLVLDQGNSFTKCALFEAGELRELAVIPNMDTASMQAKIQSWQGQYHKAIFSGVGESSIKQLIHSQIDALVTLNAETKVPFNSLYKSPETWGMDRKALVMGAYGMYSNQAKLIIDAGSCITFDFLDAMGAYHGGSIHPGLHMRAKAMHHFTARLPEVELPHETALIGDDTQSNLQSGALNGFKLEIKATIDAYQARYPQMITLITGGDAKYLAEYVKNGIFAAPNLLLLGLNNILEYNAD
jgi:type III pantothenate kinase